ncbi:hypothetical protein [Bradyrhizobium sp. AZCC 2289]|uniref:hypothetical protein n=1 Tax=Bradyrhizobium sp. AZCC 2289 TaxID=3117026 RepID=UPI002FEFB6EE
MNANGGRFVAFRRGSERLPIKGIYAESPSTAMGQDGAAARVTWQNEASKRLATGLPAEVQKQLAAEGLSAVTPDNSGD